MPIETTKAREMTAREAADVAAAWDASEEKRALDARRAQLVARIEEKSSGSYSRGRAP